MKNNGRTRINWLTLLVVTMLAMGLERATAQSAPFVNAGLDRTVADTDGVVGESVRLAGTTNLGTSSTCCIPLAWTDAQGNLLATGATPTVRLVDGVNQLTLTGTDAANSVLVTDTVIITVGNKQLENLGRTPNRRALGHSLGDLCDRLTLNQTVPASAMNLSARCAEVLNEQDPALQANALDQLGAEDFNAIRSVSVIFSQTQFQSVMDRLMALRGGQRGIQLDGLAFTRDGRTVTGQQIAESVRKLGGGAGADSDAAGVLNDRLGFWLRGNLGSGEKEATTADTGFEAEQLGVTGGVDYRFGRDGVLGFSLGYGESEVDFKSSSESGIDSTSIAASLYGAMYAGAWYFDAVVNYIAADYDTRRHIAYSLSGTSIEVTPVGASQGETLSAGGALGYDLSLGGFTLAPSIGYYYVSTGIDAFAETGGLGLDLAFGDQHYVSSTGNVGLRMSYAWKTSWSVVLPHLRGAFVREFNDDVEVFGVRFADDPFAAASNPTAPITVLSDEIDPTYFRVAAGLSLQFKYGIAGYFDYQRIVGLEGLTFDDLTLGLRVQSRFR